MAIDNLNYYSAWLPAGQQTDRYSSQPWCLRSKNLDIFSSSKSVKATAWSEPVTWDSWVIASEWGLELRTDWKVYENWTVLVDPSINFPVYKVSYDWRNGTYEDAEWGMPQDMTVAYEWDERKSFIVFTDRASYTYSKVKYVPKKTIVSDKFEALSGWERYTDYSFDWFWFHKLTWKWQGAYINITVDNSPFTWPITVRLFEHTPSTSSYWIQLSHVYQRVYKYYYDPELDAITPNTSWVTSTEISFTGSLSSWITFNLPTAPTPWTRINYMFEFTFSTAPWVSDTAYNWDWVLWLDVNQPDSYSPDINSGTGDYNEYYSYLPVRNRKLTSIGEYYWQKWTTFQVLSNWESSWIEVNWDKKIRYDFVQYMGWTNDPTMNVVQMIIWNESVYMIGNMNGNWYIIPCDLSWGRWTPFIAYGCEFLWAVNIDYLLYLVWEDRGISQLWIYNWQELVSALWWTEENDTRNLIDNTEQYKFAWKMVNYRKNLILSTTDNRILAYWQTYGWKWGVFIHELPSEASITSIISDWKDIKVFYSITDNGTTVNYITTLQDDTPIKNYNSEWMAEYPIVIWNHLLEKEESDLFVSYILPSAETSLEFWGMANHYHFRTFTSEDDYTFSTTASYKMKWCTWNYSLKFIEKNGDQYTFRLEGDLPIQTSNEMRITDSEWVELINYSDFNHFRKIWEITTTEYKEWEFRFHNLNNKLELPKSHSLQIMVRGKGNQTYTPELFALDLVANQRERW